MKIIKATDYGFRKVVQVVLNPDDPQWVHDDGPAPEGHTGDTAESDTACHDCRINWKVVEVKWDGDEMYNVAEDGTKILKTDDELVVDIKAYVELMFPISVAQPISVLEGQVL